MLSQKVPIFSEIPIFAQSRGLKQPVAYNLIRVATLQNFQQNNLKGQSNDIFGHNIFFHNLNLPRPLTNGLNYFRFWLGIRQVIRIFQSSRGITPPVDSISPRGISFKTKIRITPRNPTKIENILTH